MSDQIKVLILDDEPGIVDYMSKILMLKGYQTVTANEGEEAVRVFQEQRPDICLLDVHLTNSNIDGVEALARIMAIDSRAKCVMISRITDQEKVNRAKELGADQYLLKPLDTKDIIDVVNMVAQSLREERCRG